ncbi:peptidyl-prolyl cis-trans isomerase, fkbp-type [Treponema primitia ZAS-2]|uniref:Peptidyl-prolyl cis-trans isomerase n=1 Tax=Treponema primitia (strain ATCC BAA-887 / DSM 12427 / ZAS-2) TaxID=545694 RepID=F5YR28_TREPZ|nr:peptidylprolyl isomerase [Treponema primitia]AEF85595.1 peptidyl-prolyl cis-trans isomerase, fkbp-type [Treponema primitia ZAS-2]
MNITKDRVISINYTLTNSQNQILDSSGSEPFSYLHGHQNIIPGLEKALDGKNQGDSFKVNVPAADAYGKRDDRLITTVSLDRFSGADSVKPGMQFHAETPDGELQMVTVTKVEGNTVTIDGNHPMAGLDLNFDVAVVDIREASEEELAHGHVHSHSHDEEDCDCDDGDCEGCHDCG